MDTGVIKGHDTTRTRLDGLYPTRPDTAASLDVGCFAPLKRSYGQIMDVKINHIDKLEFLDAYKQARMKVFTESNIRSGFTATGLVPYNPDQVLSRLNI